ncbi:pyridoxamine 5'-phosphate oxidase family protein [Nocardioides sp. zg-578]|nr:pyridoxamine 5'-phosphate oxidase family protein [Nocardioides marmotae]MTB84518.1 hypothetical protein [Nocardioides marmotae]
MTLGGAGPPREDRGPRAGGPSPVVAFGGPSHAGGRPPPGGYAAGAPRRGAPAVSPDETSGTETGSGAVVERLSLEDCWDVLEPESFGRLAYRLVDEVHVVPIDYAADGHRIHLRTGAGNKLLAAALESDVALEIDWRGTGAAWSVVVRGRLRRLEPGESPSPAPPVRPWLEGVDHEVVELVAVDVAGRRFTWDAEADRSTGA